MLSLNVKFVLGRNETL